MLTASHTFWLPRRGNSPAEYEDASAADDASGRYAVADGASEGCFTGLWARLLVEDFARNADRGMEQWPTSLSAVQKRWDADVGGRKLAYHAESWVRQGAFAAFLGVALTPSGDGSCQWQAVAVGDTCLFHTRGAALLRAFPMEHSEQFGNAPRLVGARAAEEDVRTRCRFWLDGRSQPGDRLWLMTDALAQWCLAEGEAGGNPWAELESLLSSARLPSPVSGRGAGGEGGPFAEWIEGLRDRRRLRNDDATLLAILLQE
jgi:hypothetical protein